MTRNLRVFLYSVMTLLNIKLKEFSTFIVQDKSSLELIFYLFKTTNLYELFFPDLENFICFT